MNDHTKTFKRKKRQTLIVIIVLASFAISCILGVGLITLLYQRSIIDDFIWMILLLLFFISINVCIWNVISFNLLSKVINMAGNLKENVNEGIFCYNCGTRLTIKNLKNEINPQMINIYSVEGYFCEKCYMHYFYYTIMTILSIGFIYILSILGIPTVFSIMFSILPEPWFYLVRTDFPLLIIMITTSIIYSIYGIVKRFKIYPKNVVLK